MYVWCCDLCEEIEGHVYRAADCTECGSEICESCAAPGTGKCELCADDETDTEPEAAS